MGRGGVWTRNEAETGRGARRGLCEGRSGVLARGEGCSGRGVGQGDRGGVWAREGEVCTREQAEGGTHRAVVSITLSHELYAGLRLPVRLQSLHVAQSLQTRSRGTRRNTRMDGCK